MEVRWYFLIIRNKVGIIIIMSCLVRGEGGGGG